jgi:hypothetical protein
MADARSGRSLAPVDIASTTINCRRSLERCTYIRSLNNDGWAENRLADFNVWDAGLGASSSRRASLEDRLALKTHVRIAVLNLLILYYNAIEVVKDLGKILISKPTGNYRADLLQGYYTTSVKTLKQKASMSRLRIREQNTKLYSLNMPMKSR